MEEDKKTSDIDERMDDSRGREKEGAWETDEENGGRGKTLRTKQPPLGVVFRPHLKLKSRLDRHIEISL